MTLSEKTLFYSQLSAFHRLYGKSLSMRLSMYDVQPGYLTVLSRLWEADNITQKALHATLDIEQATLSNTLKRMERDGLIIRTRERKDRRRHRITLTSRARELQQTVDSAIADLETTVNKGLTVNDLRYFNRIMRQMIDQLETDQEEPMMLLLEEIPD